MTHTNTDTHTHTNTLTHTDTPSHSLPDHNSNRSDSNHTVPCSPNAFHPDPIARLSAPTHNTTPQAPKHQNTFTGYGQGCGYDRRKGLIAVRRLRIINTLIGKNYQANS